jgi:hypothetical protein
MEYFVTWGCGGFLRGGEKDYKTQDYKTKDKRLEDLRLQDCPGYWGTISLVGAHRRLSGVEGAMPPNLQADDNSLLD